MKAIFTPNIVLSDNSEEDHFIIRAETKVTLKYISHNETITGVLIREDDSMFTGVANGVDSWYRSKVTD